MTGTQNLPRLLEGDVVNMEPFILWEKELKKLVMTVKKLVARSYEFRVENGFSII